MIAPPRWTDEQLRSDLSESTEFFRRERMEEPLEDYLELFENFRDDYDNLLEITVDLQQLEGTILDVLTDRALLEAFRYLAGPPISTDDLKTIADVASLEPSRLRRDPDMVQRVLDVVMMGIDRKRFPWVRVGLEPTEAEREAAVVASAALMATQRASTNRRRGGKNAQERRVEGALLGVGFRKVSNRPVGVMGHAPAPGEFCGESLLSNRKADFIVTLFLLSRGVEIS